MPDVMPGWYGLQKLGNELVPCQIDLSEFELSGPLKRVAQINGDGEKYGYFVCYSPDIDDKRYYQGPNGYLPINWPQMYYRSPFWEVPEHEFENPAYIGILYRTPTEPNPSEPFKRWWWEVTDKIADEKAYSVNYAGDGLGYFIGCYHHDLIVYRTDEWGNYAYRWWRKPSNSESVSYLINSPGNNGINIGTESDSGPELYWFPDFDASKCELSAHYGGGMTWLLGRSGCKQTGNLIGVSSKHDVGGKLAKYNAGWPTFTPECRDTDGFPLVIWDAIERDGKYIAGCSRGKTEYHDFHAGRLAIFDGGWQIKSLQSGGTAGIISLVELSCDPDWLYMCTTYGEIWRTRDLVNFENHFTGMTECDIQLFEVEGRPVAVSAMGKVYERPDGTWREVLDFQDAFWAGKDFCAVQPGPRGLLAGPITAKDNGGTKIIKLRYEI